MTHSSFQTPGKSNAALPIETTDCVAKGGFYRHLRSREDFVETLVDGESHAFFTTKV